MTDSGTTNNWEELRESLANQSDLALVVVDESRVLSSSNNNSICRVLNKKPEFASQCAMFCGKAFEQAVAADHPISVKCHAGLHFQALPVKFQNKELVTIVGRTFTRAEDYKEASSRAMKGDWSSLPFSELFENVLLSTSEAEISKLVKRLGKLTDEEKQSLFEVSERGRFIEESQALNGSRTSEVEASVRLGFVNEKLDQKYAADIEEMTVWRSLFTSLLGMEYREAIDALAAFLKNRYQLSSIAWLENRDNILESIWSSGSFSGQQIQISISAADSRFLDVVHRETSLELRERSNDEGDSVTQTFIHLFPMTVGEEVRNALVIGDPLDDEDTKRHISRLIRQISSEIEILHLRDEIRQQSVMTKAVRKLNQTLKRIDSVDFWSVLVQNAAEMMHAERGSILILDEETEKFKVKGAVGNQADVIKMLASKYLGERVARNVLRTGRPLIIRDAKKSGIPVAPPDWHYSSNSFICYPIIISGKKIGVLNLTDKTDDSFYNEKDLEILHAFVPQIALALDRTTLMRKAGEFEQLSITDPLTGLLNRRYLEERLTEELNRSHRHGYPMSFFMIDVDNFKAYNDTFGHTEGDKALQMVGQALKATLRGADVAARYGGEEFSILLPQTTIKEAQAIAERIRQNVEDARIANRKVTISIGIAACSAELNTADTLIEAADTALYKAKEAGRNRVEIFTPEMEHGKIGIK